MLRLHLLLHKKLLTLSMSRNNLQNQLLLLQLNQLNKLNQPNHQQRLQQSQEHQLSKISNNHLKKKIISLRVLVLHHKRFNKFKLNNLLPSLQLLRNKQLNHLQQNQLVLRLQLQLYQQNNLLHNRHLNLLKSKK